MLASQVILSGLVLFILFKTVQTSRRKKLPRPFLLFWVFVWVAGLVVILHPSLLSSVASVLHIGRGVDVAVYVSVIILFYLIYSLFVALADLRAKLTAVVRSQALRTNDNEES